MSQIFRSFEANSGDYLTKMIGKSDQKGFSAVGSLFSDSLLGACSSHFLAVAAPIGLTVLIMERYGALVLLWSIMSVAVPSDCGDDINVQAFFDRMIGEWKGEAVTTPVGPRPYDIAFKRLESTWIYGTADPGAAIHHWGFYCDKDKLWLRFLSTFRGNRDPILLQATAINVSEIHFKAKLPTFLEVKIRSGQTQNFIEVLHYDQRHVLIELVSTAQ